MLSNLPPRADAPHQGAVEYRPVRPNELDEALGLLLGTASGPASGSQISEFAAAAAQRGIDLRNLWVVWRQQVIWGVLPILSPGRTMLLLVPPFRPGQTDVSPLLQAVCAHFAGRGVHLAQVLLDPADRAGRDLFRIHGFEEIAELLYLQALIGGDVSPSGAPAGFSWQTYTPDAHALFARTILESYHESLDCPRLNGLRDIEDVIAGHKAAGAFDPRFWFLLSEGDQCRGVLLLNRVPRSDIAELVYLGLIPVARGRGLGDLALREALAACGQMSAARLSLAVDSRNAPALALYYRHGMSRVGAKAAMMRDLRAAAPPSRPDLHIQSTRPINL